MSRLQDYLGFLAARPAYGAAAPNGYDPLWRWSIGDPGAFWQSICDFFDVRFHAPPSAALADARMPGAVWFPGATLNYAEHVFRNARDDAPALITVDEAGQRIDWSWQRLTQETAAVADWLRRVGVGPGDRVVGYLPNGAEAVVALLATASLGAVWAGCNLDVSVPGVLDRFAQLEPTVLVAATGVQYGGRHHDRSTAIEQLQQGLPTLRATLTIGSTGTGATPWSDVLAVDPPELAFTAVGFDHPLWVLFSSGTTGAPKGIVHGHGGIVLEHLKCLGLHLDLDATDRFFWACSTSWMVWNVLVSGLLVGATIVLYDGHPSHPSTGRLWQVAAQTGSTSLGCAPAYLQACEKDGVHPGKEYDVSAVRAVNCTGAPVPVSAYAWLDAELPGVPLNSISGGTDVAGGFVGGAPSLPVYPGENSAACLGVALAAWNPNGEPVVDEVGELVVTVPMPSMPLWFWNDPDGSKYRDAYFDTFPGVWRHGDWITVTTRGSVIVHGRSDATLNRHGVRLGSAEIYQAVEALPEVVESLVVGVEERDGGYWMPLFVVLADGLALDAALEQRIREQIRHRASTRHVPDEILVVPALPHTLTGKRLEVPVKRILMGTPVEQAVNLGSIDDPSLLEAYAELGRARARS